VRDLWPDQCPFLIGQVARIARPVASVRGTVLKRPDARLFRIRDAERESQRIRETKDDLDRTLRAIVGLNRLRTSSPGANTGAPTGATTNICPAGVATSYSCIWPKNAARWFCPANSTPPMQLGSFRRGQG
jgi:hypothetical protein